MSLVLLLLSSPGASLDPVRAALRGVPDLVPIDGDGCRDLVRQPSPSMGKIGRASCRERV